MKRARLAIVIAALAVAAGGCGGTDSSDAGGDETVQEMQAEINRLKAELDLATTGTTAVTLAPDTTSGGSAPVAGPTELMPIFDELLLGLVARTDELGARVTQANAAWENEAATFEATHAVFTDVMIQAAALSLAARELPIPPELEVRYAELLMAFQELADSTASLVTGLEAPDDGTLRKAAADRVARWVVSVQDAAVFD